MPTPAITVSRELIFAERKFVASPLSCGLRIGGAAEFGGLSAVPNYKRSDALVALAKQYLPDLDSSDSTKWAGQASVLIFASAYVLLNLLADVLSIVTNPKLRHAK